MQDLDQIGVKSMKFIEALGREKQRLAQETEQLRQTHKTKEKLQKQASAEGHAQIKAFRLSLLLQEANSISRSLKKHAMFTRYEAPAIMDEPPILYVQVTNMKLGIFTLWSPEKFEEKLISMRELYQGTSDDNGDVFFDPSDKWEADVRSPSPTKRSRYSLSRQKSGQFLRKVSGEAIPALDNTSCLSACKQWVSLAVEDLDKKLLSSNLIDLILACLQLVMDSSKELAEVYNESGCLVPCNAQTQSLCFKSSSAVDNLILAVKHLQSCIPESNSLATCLDNLVTEVKMLGRNFVFLLHGCECAINSVITESREKIDQSVLSITKQLGQLAVAMGSEMKILTTEQCSLQQAEIVHNPMKESFLSGAEMHISDQIDAGICSIGGLANFLQNLEPENKLAHVVKQKLTSIGSDLQYVMQKSKAVWNNFVSANGTRKDISNICLQEHIASCKTLNTDLGSLEDAWKSTCNAVLQCIRGQEQDFQVLKKDIENICKAAMQLSNALGSFCAAVQDEYLNLSAEQLTLMNKEAEAAASEVYSSSKDLLEFLEKHRSVNCPISRSDIQKHKSELPTSPRIKSNIQLWGRSGSSVRVAVAELNYLALTGESMTSKQKRAM